MDERHKRPGWIPLVHAWHCDGFSCIYSFAGDCNHEWRRRWHPTLLLLPGKSHGRKSLVGYSPWGHEESDMTERPHFHFSLSCIGEENGNPLQCSCLENPRDGGAWWAAVSRVAQSRTWLKWLSSSSSKKPKSNPFHYTVEVRNRFNELDPIDRVPEELWMEVCDIVQETEIKTIPKKKKCKKPKWLSGEALQIAEKRETKGKAEKERY